MTSDDSLKDLSWINMAPGVAVEVEYSTIEYSTSMSEDEIDARLTGRVRITQESLFAADFLTDPLTGEKKD